LPQKLESSTSADTIEVLEKKLKETKEWRQVKSICQGKDFDDVPEMMTRNFALCFLIASSSL